MKKCGYIAIVGRPNVGKSTLLNALLGEKIAIVSQKPQTTRNRILGVLTKGESQFVFVDTPGIHKPQNRLGDFMVETAENSMREADAVVLMVQVGREVTSVEKNVIDYLKKSGTPGILALNKTDLVTPEEIAANGFVTTEKGIKYIVSYLGYDKIAELKDTYTTGFVDEGYISEGLIGYAAIAKGLKIFSGNAFMPQEYLKRNVVAQILYNLISN